MAMERVERRLAAILAADVAGYSRLIGADEEGTLARLKAHRNELIDLKIAEHRGRIVKTTGDGLLVEFASVVDALRCASELQSVMGERNAAVPADRQSCNVDRLGVFDTVEAIRAPAVSLDPKSPRSFIVGVHAKKPSG